MGFYMYIYIYLMGFYLYILMYAHIYIWIMNHRSDKWDAHPSREPSLATCGFEAINVMIRAAKSMF
jgi:hypothetical protein